MITAFATGFVTAIFVGYNLYKFYAAVEKTSRYIPYNYGY
jgi:hypothetical protein